MKLAADALKLSARDLARIGLMMARDGRWEDGQLVSAHWVARSTASHTTVPGGWQGYGCMGWAPPKAWPFRKRTDSDVVIARDAGEQHRFVDRSRDPVIVHQVDLPRFFTGDVTPKSIGGLRERILSAAPEAIER